MCFKVDALCQLILFVNWGTIEIDEADFIDYLDLNVEPLRANRWDLAN